MQKWNFNIITTMMAVLCCCISCGTYAHAMQDYPARYAYQQQTQQSNATNEVTITTDGTYRYISSNGVPYWHGRFPNPHNPNAVLPQNYRFKVLLNPELANQITQLQNYIDFGVGIDGVPFDPGTAALWNNDPNWRYEAIGGALNLGLDANNAHVQPDGAYHYHGLPTELMNQNNKQHSTLVGYAADGFPIYALYGYAATNDLNSVIKELRSSYKLKSGARPANGPKGAYDGAFTEDYEFVSGAGDLDECNGRFCVTPEYSQGTYAYYITRDFPFIPRCFKGTPDQSFMKSQEGQLPSGKHTMHQPPPFR